MKPQYTEKQNPLKLLEKGKLYRKDKSPLSRMVVDTLIRQRYLSNQFAIDASTGHHIPMFALSYRGAAFQAKPCLDEWKYNDEQVARELDGIEVTALLYGPTKK